MANITIKYESKPKLEKPIVIEGLPGVGNVGKIAADFLCEKLKAKKFATVYSDAFPPQVLLDEDCVVKLACNDLYYAKDVGGKDIVFLLGDFQGSTPEGQYRVCEYIMKEVFLKMGVSFIYTLGGYSTGVMVEKPRILGAVSDKKLRADLRKKGVTFAKGEPSGGIVGASGLFIGFGQLYDVPAACIMGETSGYFIDHKCSVSMLKVLEKILGIKVDKKDLMDKSKQIDELTAKVKEIENNQGKEDLGYIG